MRKVFAVIDGQVFISQAVVEQAAQAISRVVVMNFGTGELKFAELPADDANELLEKVAGQLLQSRLGAELRADIEKLPTPVDQAFLDQIREYAAKGAREGCLAVAEELSISKAHRDQLPNQVIDPLWSIKVGVTSSGTFYLAGIGTA